MKKIRRLKMDEYNRRRRAKRRVLHEAYWDEELTLYKGPPTFHELKNALAEATENHLTIIRLAALMNNLSIYHSFRVTSSRTQHFGHPDDCRGRTIGIREFLSKVKHCQNLAPHISLQCLCLHAIGLASKCHGSRQLP